MRRLLPFIVIALCIPMAIFACRGQQPPEEPTVVEPEAAESPAEEPAEEAEEQPAEEPAAEPEEAQGPLAGKRVAILIGDGFHDGETTVPRDFLKTQGAVPTIIGAATGDLTAYNSDVTVTVEKAIADISPDDFDALVIPGGRSPAELRQNEDVVSFVREFFETEKPVAAICHGPQVLVTAGVMKGRKSTAFQGIADELREAGAEFEDKEMIRDGHLITSRVPADLPYFNKAILEALAQ